MITGLRALKRFSHPFARIALIALAELTLVACGKPGAASADSIVFGKCLFEKNDITSIKSGSIFLYALRDQDGSGLHVVTGKAEVPDSLIDRVARQPLKTILPARIIDASYRLEFGGLSKHGTGRSEYFVGLPREPNGEVTVSIGGTYGTDFAYPFCAFWE